MRRLLRSWRARVAVAGHSMEPTLRDGDWLLVDPDAYLARPPALGDLVVALDPRDASRLLIKRVAAPAARGGVRLAGDHPSHAVEMGLDDVPLSAVLGRAWLRYRPLRRFGAVR